MSMYIIETDDDLSFDVQFLQAIGAEPNGVVRIRHIEFENLEELNSDYINEHYGELQDTAYKKGLHDGESKCGYCNEYQRGLDDAWEAARKIVRMPEGDLLNIFTECYSAVCTALQVLLKYDASEAIEKLKDYEEKQKAADEIKAGDEVIYNGTTKCIVVRPEDDERYASLIDGDGTLYSADHRECKKTGRHFDIDKILEEMKE